MEGFFSSLLGLGRPKSPDKRHPPTITFLDVDGVLNHSNSDITQLFVIESECMKLLKHLVDQTSTDIVLSSTWRQEEKSKQILQNYFKESSIPMWVGMTPHLNNRADEILCWLAENTNFPFASPLTFEDHEILPSGLWPIRTALTFEESKRDIAQFIVLDDMDLLKCGPNSELLKEHFIRTSISTGLTKEDTERAIKLLLHNNVR